MVVFSQCRRDGGNELLEGESGQVLLFGSEVLLFGSEPVGFFCFVCESARLDSFVARLAALSRAYISIWNEQSGEYQNHRSAKLECYAAAPYIRYIRFDNLTYRYSGPVFPSVTPPLVSS